jgi:rare lipoprotein A
MTIPKTFRSAACIAFACCIALPGWAAQDKHHHASKPTHAQPHKSGKHAQTSKRKQERHAKTAHLDRSGKARKGLASYYDGKGRKMADGTRFNPNARTAASKTLPLGTKARVTNLDTGKSETVEVRDRGPYVKDRIVDVTPKVAQDLKMKKDGVAPVEVKPVELPPPKGAEEAAR